MKEIERTVCSVCDSCHSTPIFADQVYRNHEKVKGIRNGTI